MTIAAPITSRLYTPAEYLALEEKSDANQWLYRVYETPESVIQSPALTLETALSVIYEDIDWGASQLCN